MLLTFTAEKLPGTGNIHAVMYTDKAGVKQEVPDTKTQQVGTCEKWAALATQVQTIVVNNQ